MLDLHKNARPDERFHLQLGPPTPVVSNWWLARIVRWQNVKLADGTPGSFTNWWLFGNAIKWYTGTAKCDGSRTRMYWAGQLDDSRGTPYVPDYSQHVMTTTPKEMFTLRFFTDPSAPKWDTMGGA